MLEGILAKRIGLRAFSPRVLALPTLHPSLALPMRHASQATKTATAPIAAAQNASSSAASEKTIGLSDLHAYIFDHPRTQYHAKTVRTGDNIRRERLQGDRWKRWYPEKFTFWPREKELHWVNLSRLKREAFKKSQQEKGKISFPKRREMKGTGISVYFEKDYKADRDVSSTKSVWRKENKTKVVRSIESFEEANLVSVTKWLLDEVHHVWKEEIDMARKAMCPRCAMALQPVLDRLPAIFEEAQQRWVHREMIVPSTGETLTQSTKSPSILSQESLTPSMTFSPPGPHRDAVLREPSTSKKRKKGGKIPSTPTSTRSLPTNSRRASPSGPAHMARTLSSHRQTKSDAAEQSPSTKRVRHQEPPVLIDVSSDGTLPSLTPQKEKPKPNPSRGEPIQNSPRRWPISHPFPQRRRPPKEKTFKEPGNFWNMG